MNNLEANPQDVVNALLRQREAAMNETVRLDAALAAATRRIADLEKLIPPPPIAPPGVVGA